MPRGVDKNNLPSKVCVVCQRPFTWRKKWEDAWDEVHTCSDRCKNERKRLRNAANRAQRDGAPQQPQPPLQPHTSIAGGNDDDEHQQQQQKQQQQKQQQQQQQQEQQQAHEARAALSGGDDHGDGDASPPGGRRQPPAPGGDAGGGDGGGGSSSIDGSDSVQKGERPQR